jgi:lipopolysaccharide export system protein LptC
LDKLFVASDPHFLSPPLPEAVAQARRLKHARDYFVAGMKIALPLTSVALFMLLLIGPVLNTREFSFLIAKDKVALSSERMRSQNPVYRGLDKKNQPFEIRARQAIQKTSKDPTVMLEGMTAWLKTSEGVASVSAQQGSYSLTSEQLFIKGPIRFGYAKGYEITAGDTQVDIPTRMVMSVSPVSGRTPIGRFQAQSFSADINGEVARLSGRVKLRIEQQQ